MDKLTEHSYKIILDLCGGTGAWSQPYADNGYERYVIDLPQDARLLEKWKRPVYGVLAAPPCTHFSGSGAQYWKAKDKDGRTIEALSIVDACLRFIMVNKPVFWCLENPVGRLIRYLGEPVIYFQPYEYGDPYTKKTCLWGKFNIPIKNPIEPVRYCKQGSWLQQLGGKSERTKALRSITPSGFAQAFFEANK